MLHLARANRFEPWSSGAAKLHLRTEASPERRLVAVRCRLGRSMDSLALLDTGAEWSVIGKKALRILEQELGAPIFGPVSYSTRFGLYKGHLHKVTVELLADDGHGTDFEYDATALILPEWSGPTVLGFRGFLEQIRIALDPAGRKPMVYFGAAA